MAATSISHNDFEKIVDSNQCLVNRSEALVMLIEKLEDAPWFDMDFALDLTMCSADFICVKGSTIQ